MRKPLIALCALVALSACSPTLKMQDESIKPGEYRVVAMEVVPQKPLSGDALTEFEQFQPLLHKELVTQLTGKGSGREVWLSVQVMSTDLSISSTKAILIGDNYSIMSDAILMEPETRRVLGNRLILNRVGQRSGIAGAIADGLMSSEDEFEDLAQEHAERIVDALYP